MRAFYSHLAVSSRVKMDGVEKVKQAIAATIQNSEKQSHLVKSHLLWQDGRSSAYVFRYRPPTPQRISQRNGYDTISCSTHP